MKLYNIPHKVQSLIFDIDHTLYTSRAYGNDQKDRLLKCIAAFAGVSFEEVEEKIVKRQEETGLSLAIVSKELYGVTIEHNVKWRAQTAEPEKFLSTDKSLQNVLTMLSQHVVIGALTNNPTCIGERTLEVLGIRQYFSYVVGLDTTMESKPSHKPFEAAFEKSGHSPTVSVVIGDRYKVDLEYPLSRGAGGVLVHGVETCYKLTPALFNLNSN